ncbi:MAG TPA: hypothetical protein VFG84_05340 [Gemmatimonadaceae bacterium]|nr:hypothetical protein [Gemmatimonadaceae bacterium]
MERLQGPSEPDYPRGRGYGHDYMRGGEVLGGYGYSARDEYSRNRGERPLDADSADSAEPLPDDPAG